MSAIGAVTVHIIRGLPQRKKTRVDVWEVAGLDGYGAQLFGLGDAAFDLQSIVYCASGAAADSVILAAEAQQGSVVSITDDWGETHDGVLVVHVDSARGKQPCIYQGNALAVRLTLGWRLVRI